MRIQKIIILIVSILLMSHVSCSSNNIELVGEWKQVQIEILEVEGNNNEAIAKIEAMYSEMTEDRKKYILETLTFSTDSTCRFQTRNMDNEPFTELWNGKVQIKEKHIEIINSTTDVNGTMLINNNHIYWDFDITPSIINEYNGISKFVTRLTYQKISTIDIDPRPIN